MKSNLNRNLYDEGVYELYVLQDNNYLINIVLKEIQNQAYEFSDHSGTVRKRKRSGLFSKISHAF